MILWLLSTIAVACLAVLAGRWRPWAAGAALAASTVLAFLLAWRRQARAKRPGR